MSAAVVIFLILLIATVIGGLIYYYYYYKDNDSNNNNIPITPDTILYGDKIQIQLNPCPTKGSYNPPNCTATIYLGACGNYPTSTTMNHPVLTCGESVSFVTDPGFINSTNTVFTVSGGPVGKPVGMEYFTLMNYNGNYICYCKDDPSSVVYAASPTIQFKSLDPSLYSSSNPTPYTILKQNSSIYLNLPSKDNCSSTTNRCYQYLTSDTNTGYIKCSTNSAISTNGIADTQFIVVKRNTSLPPSPPHPLALPPPPSQNTPSIITMDSLIRIKNIATGAYIADCGRVVAGCKILSLSKTKWAPVYLNSFHAGTGTPVSNFNTIGSWNGQGVQMGLCIAGRANQQIPITFVDYASNDYMRDCSDINSCSSGKVIFNNTSNLTLTPSQLLADTKGIYSLSINNISMTGDCVADLVIENTDSNNKNQLWQFELVPS